MQDEPNTAQEPDRPFGDEDDILGGQEPNEEEEEEGEDLFGDNMEDDYRPVMYLLNKT
jgi:DNA replication licensing factor MCM2